MGHIEEELYIVQYNDKYGNANDVFNECVVKSVEDFDIWFKEHNESRVALGDREDDRDEYDLIRITLYTPIKN
jgi:hypothetical protein